MMRKVKVYGAGTITIAFATALMSMVCFGCDSEPKNMDDEVFIEKGLKLKDALSRMRNVGLEPQKVALATAPSAPERYVFSYDHWQDGYYFEVSKVGKEGELIRIGIQDDYRKNVGQFNAFNTGEHRYVDRLELTKLVQKYGVAKKKAKDNRDSPPPNPFE